MGVAIIYVVEYENAVGKTQRLYGVVLVGVFLNCVFLCKNTQFDSINLNLFVVVINL